MSTAQRISRWLLTPLRRWVEHRENAMLIRYFIQRDQAMCDGPALPFVTGDRVKAKNHKWVDDQGGTGTVVNDNHWHGLLQRRVLAVQFDSMPKGRLMYMPAAEFVYDRGGASVVGVGVGEAQGR